MPLKDGARPKFRSIRIRTPTAKAAESIHWVGEFETFLNWLLVGPAEVLTNQLNRLRYVGPLRVIPERGAPITRRISRSDWADGSAAWATLANSSSSLRARVSAWMADVDRLNTGYSISVRKTQEFEIGPTGAKSLSPIGQQRTRMALLDGSGLQHDPQDVGVGVSQILPVVVAALDSRASLVCIEQPELHVHPAVQVGLGDLFIEGAVNQGLSFLIETHSEHLILRLLRRIRETHEGDCDKRAAQILPEFIAINCLTKANGTVTVDQIPVTAAGDFAKPWPHGFFDERGAELF
jgi:hypothetical protein